MEGATVNVSRDNAIDITNTLEGLQVTDKQTELSPLGSETELGVDCCGAKWLRVRDSLEGISAERGGGVGVRERPRGSEAHAHSDSRLSATKHRHLNQLSKIFLWDPWNKIGRRGKKDKGRKKGGGGGGGGLGGRCAGEPEVSVSAAGRVRGDTGGEPSPILRKIEPPLPTAEDPATDHHHDQDKCVRFQRDVQVVYFAGDQVLQTGMEPLRREQEQHERNKELRGRDLLAPPTATAATPPPSTSRNALRRAHSHQ